MERITDKHGARLDDAMSHEVESLTGGAPVEARSQDGRMQEPTADDEARIDPGVRWDDGDNPGIGVSERTAEERADLAAAVASAAWPATRDQLMAAAAGDHAPSHVVRLLDRLPHGDRAYETVQAVWSTLGGEVEGSHA